MMPRAVFRIHSAERRLPVETQGIGIVGQCLDDVVGEDAQLPQVLPDEPTEDVRLRMFQARKTEDGLDGEFG